MTEELTNFFEFWEEGGGNESRSVQNQSAFIITLTQCQEVMTTKAVINLHM